MKILRRIPEFLSCLTLLLVLLAGDMAHAAEELRPPGKADTASELLGAEAYFHFAMAKLAQRQQRYDAALAFFRQAAEADPASASIQAELANTFMIVRDYPSAEEAARRALELEPGNPQAHTVLAHLYYSRARRGIDSEENRKRAMAELEASLSGSPDDDPDVLLTLGRFYFEEEDYTRAAETLQRYAASQPGAPPNALFLLARAQIQLEDYEGAEATLVQILNSVPDSLQALETLVNIRRLRGDYAGSLPLLQHITSLQGGDVALYKKMGEAHFHTEEYAEALEMFEMALREEPGSPYSLYYLALCQERLGQLDEALATLSSMRQQQKTNSEVVFRMAQLQERLGQRQEAIVLYRELIDLLIDAHPPEEVPDGEIATFCARIALLQMEQDDYSAAIRELGSCRDRLARPAPSLELLRVRALLFAGRDEKALNELRAASTLFGDDPRFTILEAEILLQTGSEDEATALLSKRLEATSEDEEGQGTRAMVADAWFNAGAQAERRGAMERSERFLRRAIEVNPNHAPALNYLGYTWADADRNLEEALTLIERAVNLDPDNGAYQDSLGWVYYRLGRLEEARHHLQKAFATDGNDPTISEHLGDVEHKAGQMEQAQEHWQRALSLGADDADAVRRKLRDLERRMQQP